MIKKCLFPSAGYGTRFLPATKAVPKEMLPIVTKPLIQYAVQEAIDAKCDTMGIITNRYKKAIEDHFDTNTDLNNTISGSSKEELTKELDEIIDNVTFVYRRQKEIKGLGDAILQGKPFVSNEPFAVILPDDLCDAKVPVLSQMVQVYQKYPDHCIVAIEEINKQDTDKYGIVDGDFLEDNIIKITNMIEKPQPKDAPTNFAIIGRYILIPQIFDAICQTPKGKGGEIQITDALMQLAKQEKVLGYKFDGIRFDCGSIDGFVKATNYFYEKE
jgi:UTP--glucose-1-phosphate uridylyltransferase